MYDRYTFDIYGVQASAQWKYIPYWDNACDINILFLYKRNLTESFQFKHFQVQSFLFTETLGLNVEKCISLIFTLSLAIIVLFALYI